MPVTRDNQYRDWFIYATDLLSFSANEIRPVTIPVQSDADFELAYITGESSHASGFTLQVSDQSSGRKLSNVPIKDTQLCGTAQRPYVLPDTHLFQRAGVILLDIVNLGGGAASIRIALHGWKWMTLARA